MIRAIAFDFDGTLVDSNRIKRDAYLEAVRELDPEGVALRAAQARDPAGDRYRVMRRVAEELQARGAAPAGRSVAELGRALAAAYTQICHRRIAAAPEIRGATDALTALARRGLPLYVNTGTPGEAAAALIRARGLDARFAGVLGGEGGKVGNLETIASREGVSPPEILLVGDGEDDREAAQRFGCPFVGVALAGLERFSRPPELWLSDLTRLPEVVERLCEARP